MFITAIKNLIRRLFGEKPDPQARPPRPKGGKRLSHEDRRHVEAAIARVKGTDKQELSAQDSIPYDAPYPDRPSHVGIYVGNGMMIHCGSPISYANINTPYWQNHFYSFGRLREP